MPVAGDARRALALARTVVRSRAARRAVRRELAHRDVPASGTFAVAVHFPDSPVNLYQIRQWYGPLAAVADDLPTVVVARYATTARVLLEECPLPVVLAPRIADVEELLHAHPVRVVLYVNQNVRNFSVMRYRTPAHVFISHGESDKDYMASNQLKAYDRTFVAGPAAVARLGRLVEYDVGTRAVQVGRPQIDVAHDDGPRFPEDGRATVLYAPTWEGDRPSMAYGSVVSHGERLVGALLADGRYRVVVRPHPRTGTSDPAAARALRRIERMTTEARRTTGVAHHVDRSPAFGWHLAACDACVTDVSAVAYDWLATGKPLVVTRPCSAEAVLDDSRLLADLTLLRAEDAAGIADRLARLLAGPPPAEHRALVAHYYGDVSPGASLARFRTALADLVAERSRLHDDAGNADEGAGGVAKDRRRPTS